MRLFLENQNFKNAFSFLFLSRHEQILKTGAMSESHLADIIDNIVRGKASSIDAYLRTIEYSAEIEGADTKFYSHMIALNGNGEIRLDDFIDFIIEHIVEYVIPRSKILEANQKDVESGLSTHTVRLQKEAEKLFTPLEKTGDVKGGLKMYRRGGVKVYHSG
jgi:hypothetical protein